MWREEKMNTLKYSRQRESIKKFLMTREDHPTADTVYANVKQEFPNISLGTVYRNLSLLAEIGEIGKITCTDGADRFDRNPNPHYHFICAGCGKVLDLDVKGIENIEDIARQNFEGEIDGHIAYFYGTCPECIKSEFGTGKVIEKNS
jgi:Fur family peroxide stress response transcriptional regulator